MLTPSKRADRLAMRGFLHQESSDLSDKEEGGTEGSEDSWRYSDEYSDESSGPPDLYDDGSKISDFNSGSGANCVPDYEERLAAKKLRQDLQIEMELATKTKK